MERNEGKLHPIEFAALAHQKFVYIHPFVDGNGRVARLLMNLMLLRAGWTLAIIPPVCRHEYIMTLKKAEADPSPFVLFVRDRVCETQKELLRLMGQSVNLQDDRVKSGKNDRVNDRVNVSAVAAEILSAIEKNPGSKTRELAAFVGKSIPTVSRHLKALKESGKIEFRGAPKNGGYYSLLS